MPVQIGHWKPRWIFVRKARGWSKKRAAFRRRPRGRSTHGTLVFFLCVNEDDRRIDLRSRAHAARSRSRSRFETIEIGLFLRKKSNIAKILIPWFSRRVRAFKLMGFFLFVVVVFRKYKQINQSVTTLMRNGVAGRRRCFIIHYWLQFWLSLRNNNQFCSARKHQFNIKIFRINHN